MTTTKTLAILTLAAATLGAAGCGTFVRTNDLYDVMFNDAPLLTVGGETDLSGYLVHHDGHCR